LSLYSHRILHTKHHHHDRLRAISTAPPWACPRASAKLRRTTQPRRGKPINNIAHTRTDALLPADVTNIAFPGLRSWWRSKPTASSADELCTTRIHARNAPAIWHVTLSGSRHGNSCCCGTSRLPRAVLDCWPAGTRSSSFSPHGGCANEGGRPRCSSVTYRRIRPHGRKYATPSSDDTSGYAAAAHEHSDQQPCHAAATACDEPRRPKTNSASSDGATASTAPAVA
jgi:hypothetical protein